MECQQCNKEYRKIATHWAHSECSHPGFTDYQLDIITGVLMGDGTIDDKFDDHRNPRFRLSMTSKDYLEFLDNELSPLITKEPYIHRTAEQIANSHSGFTNSDNPEDYKTQYKIQTISHPKLKRFEQWYSSGEKVFPENLQLNPTILKHWYVCDGSYNNNGHRDYIEIHLSNERNNKDKIETYFQDIGHPISRWRDDKVAENRYKTSIIFNKDETEKLFDYMGDPLPGFSYKFP